MKKSDISAERLSYIEKQFSAMCSSFVMMILDNTIASMSRQMAQSFLDSTHISNRAKSGLLRDYTSKRVCSICQVIKDRCFRFWDDIDRYSDFVREYSPDGSDTGEMLLQSLDLGKDIIAPRLDNVLRVFHRVIKACSNPADHKALYSIVDIFILSIFRRNILSYFGGPAIFSRESKFICQFSVEDQLKKLLDEIDLYDRDGRRFIFLPYFDSVDEHKKRLSSSKHYRQQVEKSYVISLSEIYHYDEALRAIFELQQSMMTTRFIDEIRKPLGIDYDANPEMSYERTIPFPRYSSCSDTFEQAKMVKAHLNNDIGSVISMAPMFIEANPYKGRYKTSPVVCYKCETVTDKNGNPVMRNGKPVQKPTFRGVWYSISSASRETDTPAFEIIMSRNNSRKNISQGITDKAYLCPNGTIWYSFEDYQYLISKKLQTA